MIVALCPTFRRRKLLQNSIACFLAQSYEDSRLLICDDSGEHAKQAGDRWDLIDHPAFATLADKYNFLARYAFDSLGADSIAFWEDDDIYGPHYLEYHVRALQLNPNGWSHCNWIWERNKDGRLQLFEGLD